MSVPGSQFGYLQTLSMVWNSGMEPFNSLVISLFFLFGLGSNRTFLNKLISGTEVCLSVYESVDVLLAEMNCFFQKVSFFFIVETITNYYLRITFEWILTILFAVCLLFYCFNIFHMSSLPCHLRWNNMVLVAVCTKWISQYAQCFHVDHCPVAIS